MEMIETLSHGNLLLLPAIHKVLILKWKIQKKMEINVTRAAAQWVSLITIAWCTHRSSHQGRPRESRESSIKHAIVWLAQMFFLSSFWFVWNLTTSPLTLLLYRWLIFNCSDGDVLFKEKNNKSD
jgi:hypothetical protein